MKTRYLKHARRFIAATLCSLLIFGQGAIAGTTAQASSAGVTIYADIGFSGNFQTFSTGSYQSSGYPIISASSSLTVGANRRVTLYDRYGNGLVLASGNYSFLGSKWNDQAVRMVVESTSVSASPNVGLNQSRIFQHGDFGGEYYTRGVGNYYLGDFPAIGIRDLSSIIVGENMVATLIKANGQTKEFLRGNFNWVGDDWNDQSVRWTVSTLDSSTMPSYYAGQVPQPRAIPQSDYEPSGSNTPIGRKLTELRMDTRDEFEAVRGSHLGVPVRATVASATPNIALINPVVKETSRTEQVTSVIFGGSSILTNHLDSVQQLRSQEFEFSAANTVSTTTTQTVGLGVSATVGFNLFGVEMGTTISTSFDFASGQTYQQNNNVVYRIPAQFINVNPGQSVRVRARLETVRVSGTVQLNGTVTGSERGVYDTEEFRNGVWAPSSSICSYEYDVNFPITEAATGVYTAQYGTNLYIDVVDVTTDMTVAQFLAPIQETYSSRSANGTDIVVVSADNVIDLTKA